MIYLPEASASISLMRFIWLWSPTIILRNSVFHHHQLRSIDQNFWLVLGIWICFRFRIDLSIGPQINSTPCYLCYIMYINRIFIYNYTYMYIYVYYLSAHIHPLLNLYNANAFTQMIVHWTNVRQHKTVRWYLLYVQ